MISLNTKQKKKEREEELLKKFDKKIRGKNLNTSQDSWVLIHDIQTKETKWTYMGLHACIHTYNTYYVVIVFYQFDIDEKV